MNTIILLIFLFFLARIFFRLMGRGSGGKFDGPLGGPPPGMGRPIPGNEEKPKLKIPEYLTRRSEEQTGESILKKDMEEEPVEEYRRPVVVKVETAESCLKEQPSGHYPESTFEGAAVKVTCGLDGKKVSPGRKRHKRNDMEDTFSDMLSPAQVVKGMAWSIILGPRGGLRPKR